MKYVIMTSGWQDSGDGGRNSDKIYDTIDDAMKEYIEALFDKNVQEIWVEKFDTEEGE